MRPPLTRVAVAQLDVHPAALIEGRSPLEDLLLDVVHDDSLLAEGVLTPPELRQEHLALKQRIRAAYCRQLELKLAAIVTACRGWGVRVLVLPEYAVPWEVLPSLAAAARDMVVVAGTHAVEPEARDGGVYEALGWPTAKLPQEGSAVAPVLFRGGLVGFSTKLQRSRWEPDLVVGGGWGPIEIEGFGPVFGVMICKDFLAREEAPHPTLVSPQLRRAKFLAVPSFTPPHTTERFAYKAAEEARHYKRPVLYADVTAGGGTSIFADDRSLDRLAAFPLAPGVLPAGDEGVIVADVDLDLVAPGPSTAYDDRKVIEPVAQASLVYHCHPEDHRYAAWVEGVAAELGQAGEDARRVRAVIGAQIESIQSAGGLTGARARGGRLEQLWLRLRKLTQPEAIARYTREVVMPTEALPLRHLRLALAQGAEKVVYAWGRRQSAARFAVVAQRMRAAVNEVRFDDGTWTAEGRAAFEAVARAVVGEAAEREPQGAAVNEVRVRAVYPGRAPLHALRELRLGDGRTLELAATPRELRSRFSENRDGTLREADVAVEAHGGKRAGYLPWSVAEHDGLEDLYRLLVAEGNHYACVAAVRGEGVVEALVVLVSDEQGSRTLHGIRSEWLGQHARDLCSSIDEVCDERTELVLLDEAELGTRIEALRKRFGGARANVEKARERLLAEVEGRFVSPRVDRDRRSGRGEIGRVEDVDALEHLDHWVAAKDIVPGLLLHGEFGSGKSTLLAEWSTRCWEVDRSVVLVPLGGLGDADLRTAMLASADVEDTPQSRAALDLLVDRGVLTVCFDGFDEMIRDITFEGIEPRLRGLFAVGGQRSKILVASRSNYFRSPEELEAIADRVGRAVGVGDLVLMRVRPFSRSQVESLVEQVRRPEDRPVTLAKIDRIHDLGELSERPLMLGMILQTIDDLADDASIGPAQVYEAYLDRWLDQTKYEIFTPKQKKDIAEALAEALWRSGEPACSWEELRRLVPSDQLPETVTKQAALVEIRGGAFFVHEGDRFRFAHRSFLEFFLARSLVRRLAAPEEGPARVLDTRSFGPEVLEFVAEIVRRDGGEAAQHPVILAVQRWLVLRGTATGELDSTANAAANALRLLVGVAAHLGEPRGWVPNDAGLQHVVLARETLGGRPSKDATDGPTALSLVGARLDRADLIGTRLHDVDLRGATLREAKLAGASLHRVVLAGAVLDGADLTAAEVDEADLEGASLVSARLGSSTWTHCSWHGADVSETTAGGWVAPEAPNGVRPGLPSDAWLAIRRGHGGAVNAIAWDPRGMRLASAGEDRMIRIWESSSATLLAQLEHTGWVIALAWSPDGDRLASGGDDCSIHIWDPCSATLVNRLTEHKEWILALAWNPQGNQLASGSDDRTILIWDVASGTSTERIDGPGPILALAWAPQGDRLAYTGEDTVYVWDLTSKSLRARLTGHTDWTRALAWDPLGERLASAGDDRTIRIWDTTSNATITCFEGHTDIIRALSWSSDGRHLASAGNDRSVRIWNPSTETMVTKLEGHTDWIRPVAWNPQGQRLASAGDDCSICIWNPRHASLVAQIDGHAGGIRAVAWSSDGERLASADNAHTIRIWAPNSARLLARFDTKSDIRALAWSPSGERLASAGDDRIIRIWDPASTISCEEFDGETPTFALAWSPDGRRLASSGDDCTVRIWDLSSKASPPIELHGHTDRVRALAWQPQGTLLASAGQDLTISVWDLTSSTLATRLNTASKTLALTWDHRGERLLSAGDNRAVHVWNLALPTPMVRHDLLGDGARTIAWGHYGELLAAAGHDGTIRIWHQNRHLMTLSAHGGTHLIAIPGGAFVASSPPPPLMLEVHLAHARICLPLGSLARELHRPDLVTTALADPSKPPPPAIEQVAAANHWPIDPDWSAEPRILSTVPRARSPRTTPETLLAAPPNPFRPNKSLDGLTPPPGRTDVLRRILDHTREGGSAALLGPRRSGKTSLFAYLRRNPTGPLFHVSLQRITEPELTADVIATTLDPSLHGHSHPARAFRDALSTATNPVILLDELGYLTRATFGAMGWLRELSEDVASIIYAGTHGDWNAMMDHVGRAPGSSFGNNIYPIELGPLAPEDAIAFLTTTAPANVPIARAAPWVVELTEGWPFYLQVMGYALVDEVRQHRYGALQERSDLARLYEHAVLLGQAHVLRARWMELPADVQRIVLREVTRPTVVTPRDLFPFRDLRSPERIRLSRIGIGDTNRGWRIDRPFLEWIRRNAHDLEDPQ